MKTSDYITQTLQFESRSEEVQQRVADNYDIVHAIFGIGDEFLEFMMEYESIVFVDDKDSKFEPVIKEAGDVMWYIAILCRKYGYEISDAAIIGGKQSEISLVYAVQSLMSKFKKHLFYGAELDHSDIHFYINTIATHLARLCNTPIENILERNFQKLTARYGNAFDANKAINKDETKE